MSMWSILGQTLVYIGMVVLIHQLYQYVKTTFTTPKKVNYYQMHEQKYQEILDEIRRLPAGGGDAAPPAPAPGSGHTSRLTDEQKAFLKESLMMSLAESA